MIYIYKASAGSGKTFTLVREYLKLLLGKKGEDGRYRLDEHPSDNHRSILAITFTNKATDEMKKRIVKELDILSKPDGGSPYLKFLSETFGAEPEKIQTCAHTAMVQILQDFTNFNISTIDRFFQLILRTFAQESELSGNYGVEIQDDYAITVGVSDLKQSLRLNADKGKDNQDYRLLISWLETFIKSKINNGKTWDIFFVPSQPRLNSDSLAKFAQSLFKETVKNYRQELINYLSDKNKIKNFRQALNEEIDRLTELIKHNAEACLRLTESLCNDYGLELLTSPRNRLNKWANGDLGKGETIAVNDGTIAMFKKSKNKKVAEQENQNTTLCGLVEEINETISRIASFKMIADNVFQLGLLGDIYQYIHQFTTDNNVILLSDTNEMLGRIISDDDTPFIYERIGMKLRNFLIDEFQDTSNMQWQNIKPLVRNSLASGNDNLVIGDVKQSIYRFRNSDPKLLQNEIYNDFPRQTDNSLSETKDANTNWRSARNVVVWNNTFFSWLAEEHNLDQIYDNVQQQVADRNQSRPGHVVIDRIETNTESSSEGEGEEDATEDSEERKFDEIALDRMIEDIVDLTERGYRQKDIAILVNKGKEGEQVISRIMRYNREKEADKNALKVVSEESLLIWNSPAVKIVVSMLAMLDNYKGICDSSGQENTPKNITLIIKDFHSNIARGMTDTSEAFAEAVRSCGKDKLSFDSLFDSGECAALDTIAERLIQQLPEHLIRENTPYLQAFMDCIIDYMSRYGSNIHSFLDWWEDTGKKIAISSPANIDALQVMTIHKSKGLEFACVLIPFCNWTYDKGGLEWIPTSEVADSLKDLKVELPPILPVKRSTKLDKGIFEKAFSQLKQESVMDSVNKTYVAFTRAGDELIIYYPAPKPKKSKSADNDSKSVDADLEKFISENAAVNIDGRITDSEHAFEVGSKTTPQTDKQENSNHEMPAYTTLNETARDKTASKWKFKVPDELSASRDSARFEGEMMHNILSAVRVREDLDLTLRRFQAKGFITEEEQERFGKLLHEGLDNPATTEWFAPENKLMRERDIVNKQGDLYRPDRVVHRPDGSLIVIDYKFGERDDKKYARQVKGYMNILTAATGQKNISGYVWYVTDNEILKV